MDILADSQCCDDKHTWRRAASCDGSAASMRLVFTTTAAAAHADATNMTASTIMFALERPVRTPIQVINAWPIHVPPKTKPKREGKVVSKCLGVPPVATYKVARSETVVCAANVVYARNKAI